MITALFSELDAIFIAPFRWLVEPLAGFWLGTTLIAFYCLIFGELTYAMLFLSQKSRFISMQDEVIRYHNLSVDAIHAGNKEAYLAANSIAHEKFGKSYFALAAAGMARVWPVPFALAWMSLRFEGVDILQIPGTSLHAGYVFALILSYFVERLLLFPLKKYLPIFSRIEDIKRRARERRGEVHHFLNKIQQPERSFPVPPRHDRNIGQTR